MDFIVRLFRKISDLGVKRCLYILIGVVVVILVIRFAWGLEKNVKISPIVQTTSILDETKIIKVTRTMKSSDGFSLGSISSDVISGISNEAETISAFNKLVSACDDASTKKENLKIPSGAGFSDFGGIGIYIWKKTGQHFITGVDFQEIHAVILFNGQYIEAQFFSKIQNLSMGAEIQGGTY